MGGDECRQKEKTREEMRQKQNRKERANLESWVQQVYKNAEVKNERQEKKNEEAEKEAIEAVSEEWEPVDVTVDSGAFDSVANKSLCAGIKARKTEKTGRSYTAANGTGIQIYGEKGSLGKQTTMDQAEWEQE